MFDFITDKLSKFVDLLTNIFPQLRAFKAAFKGIMKLKEIGTWLGPVLEKFSKLPKVLGDFIGILADASKLIYKGGKKAVTAGLEGGKKVITAGYAGGKKAVTAGLEGGKDAALSVAGAVGNFYKEKKKDLIISGGEYILDRATDSTPEKVESLEQKLDKLIELQLAQAQKAAEEKPKEGAPASVKESPHQIAYREGLKLDADLEQGATLLKVFFDELAPVTEQFGKLKEILSSLLAPEDMVALEAKTQEVAAKEGDATAQDFNGLIEMLKQLLEKVNVILDPETGLLSPKEGSAPLVAPATGGGNATGDGASTVQETQKKGEGIEAQLEAWDEIVRKFGENAVGAFENMLESGEISIKGLTKMLVQMAKRDLDFLKCGVFNGKKQAFCLL